MSTKPGSIVGNGDTIVRVATGSPVAADPTTYNDTNFPPASDVVTTGWREVVVFPRLMGGTTPTCTLQILRRFASSWIAMELVGPLSDGQGAVVPVMGRETFFALQAVTGSPTEIDIHCGGWEPFSLETAPKR